MPKIIKDLDNKIIQSAEKLMFDKSFTQIDMRKIAKVCGIAVGTLYNHFPNKQKLFIKVFEYSWIKTFKILNEIVESDMEPKQKLREFLLVLYRDIEERQAIGKEVFQREMMFFQKEMVETFDKCFTNLANSLSKLIRLIIDDICNDKNAELMEETKERLAINVFVMMLGQMKKYPEAIEKNVDFSIEMIMSYIEINKTK